MPEPIKLKSKTITGTKDGPSLLITAGVHGDEFEPMAAVRRLIGQIEPAHLPGVQSQNVATFRGPWSRVN